VRNHNLNRLLNKFSGGESTLLETDPGLVITQLLSQYSFNPSQKSRSMQHRHTRRRRVTPSANLTYEYYDFDSCLRPSLLGQRLKRPLNRRICPLKPAHGPGSGLAIMQLRLQSPFGPGQKSRSRQQRQKRRRRVTLR
jgi:hypothetical protein